MAGKGGVGKTTVGATIGIAAAAGGLDVLLIELEGRSALAAPFASGNPPANSADDSAQNPAEQLHYETRLLEESGGGGRLRARRITPDEALRDYLDHSGLSRFSDRLALSGSVEVVATTAPGIRDLVVLGKIRQLEQAGEADLIVVDAPAAGHAVTFLQAASGLARATPTGPVRHQADLVLELLGDERRCRVVLVTTPEETPVAETIEVAYELEDRAGVTLGPLVVNRCWPEIDGLAEAVAEAERHPGPGVDADLVAAARYRLRRGAGQRAGLLRLDHELPLPRVELPYVFTDRLDRDDLGALADTLTGQLEREPV